MVDEKGPIDINIKIKEIKARRFFKALQRTPPLHTPTLIDYLHDVFFLFFIL